MNIATVITRKRVYDSRVSPTSSRKKRREEEKKKKKKIKDATLEIVTHYRRDDEIQEVKSIKVRNRVE